MKNNKAFSEVIESSLQGWLSQSWQWNEFPQFGSIVSSQVNNRITLGIVHQIQTGSSDPVRYPFPYKKTHDELLKEQPQIFEFLKTTFSCLAIGYKEQGIMYYLLPPEPLPIHSFIALSPTDIQKEFYANPAYLSIIFGLSQQLFNLDELLLALLKQQAQLKILTPERIKQFIDTFSLLSGNDYRRLKLFLARAEPLVT